MFTLRACFETLLRWSSDGDFLRFGAHGHKRPLLSDAQKSPPADSPERISKQALTAFSVVVGVTVGVSGMAVAADPKSGLEAPVGLGQPIQESDVAPWNYTVFPSGQGLPAGSGVASVGGALFAERCAACHGANGAGGTNPALISDLPLKGHGIEANKTIKNFWENPTTLFDYIRRAMPWPAPRTLSADEVYALVAYILAGNGIIAKDAIMDKTSLPKVVMPNNGNFILRYPDLI